MNQCALLILLFSVLGSFLACGVFGGSAPEGPERMVPDDVLELLVVDVGEAALSRTDLPSRAGERGLHPGEFRRCPEAGDSVPAHR